MIQLDCAANEGHCGVVLTVIGSPVSLPRNDLRFPRSASRSFLFTLLIPLFSMVLASAAAVAAGEFLINRLYFLESVVFEGGWLALVSNIVILFCFMVLLSTLLNRTLLAVFIILISYGSLIAIDIIKLSYLDDPVRPIDFQYLADLRVVARSSISAGAVIGVLAAGAAVTVICRYLWRKEPPAMPLRRRISTGLIAGTFATLFFTLPSIGAVQEWIIGHGIENPIAWQFEPRASARSNGLLVEWAVSAGNPAIRRPEHYSRSEVERVARAYRQEQNYTPVTNDAQPTNLIIYVIESFMDPLDLGLRFTADPIPTFRAISRKYSSGKVVVPVFGGTSANTEFELMTGLSMYFLSASSCPYRQYVTRDIPSLPRTLRGYGYKTVAIPADPPYLFNHKAVFGHLGFDQWLFPEEDPKTPRSPDGEFAADEAIADAVIAASREGKPHFIFAFTGGSHFPWDYTEYESSSLDLVGSMPEPSRSHLKTYINSLNVADRSIKKLIEYFEKSNERTAILIMGDHLPALSEVYEETGFFDTTGLAQIEKRYQVPAVLWCNWPAAKEDFSCSANYLAVRMLHFLGLPANGSFALNAAVQSRFPILSQYVRTADGHVFLPQAANLPFQPLLDDYRLIQYDLLQGRQYALQFPGW